VFADIGDNRASRRALQDRQKEPFCRLFGNPASDSLAHNPILDCYELQMLTFVSSADNFRTIGAERADKN